ncbi:hypothetical protein F4821DRAFT_274792 [Hypoxylon rubiginosum]|uniref:Uncharacterized protein n=1 Tax=Hypoxylon rubiginosum TaxID=110542 RepID=A0ACC0DDL5_9PEZI|nr:hypothetical protein F4821DRAFT_274792 [Hypoxylon rubiginosum]
MATPGDAQAGNAQLEYNTSMESNRNTNHTSTYIKISQITSRQETVSSELSPCVSRLESAGPNEKIDPIPNTSRLPLKESLGLDGCLIIAGGSITILAAMGFLTFLWFGYGSEPEAADATWAWRQIALRDWMTRTITISALVLRFVVSLQTSVSTSMIAALILEKRLTRKSDAAYLSISRGISDGPRRLIQILFSSGTWSTLFHIEIWLITLMAIVALCLQFSSTILISDLHRFMIVGDVGTQSIRNLCSFSGLEPAQVWPPYSYIPVYTMFGEEKSEYNITPNARGFSDSGIVRRGYLPLEGVENRTSVRLYHGTTLVPYSRTVCVPPKLNNHFSSSYFVFNDSTTFGSMTGTVDYGLSLRSAYPGVGPLCTSDECETIPFECIIPGTQVDHSSQANYCFLETVGLTSQALQTVVLNGLSDTNIPGEPWSLNSSIHLVVRSNLTALDWASVSENFTASTASTVDEWRVFEIMKDRVVSVSLCFTRFTVEVHDARLTTLEATREPKIMWDGFTVQHDTSEVTRFIGVDSPTQTFAGRGIMNMEILSVEDKNNTSFKLVKDLSPAKASAAYMQEYVVKSLSGELAPNTTFAGCIFCTDLAYFLHNDICLLFNDIIESSDRAAAALQGIVQVVSATVFDSMIKLFNMSEEVNVAVTTTVSTPGPCSSHQCFGFIAVITLLGIHLVIVVVITVLYISQVRFSRYSNIWHAISQLVSDKLKDILEQGNNAKDKVITEALKRERGDDFVKLELRGDGSRVEIVKHSDDNRKPNGTDES